MNQKRARKHKELKERIGMSVLKTHLTNESDGFLSSIFVFSRQVDFVTEDHKPFVLDRRTKNKPSGSAFITAIVIESFHDETRFGCAAEVESHELELEEEQKNGNEATNKGESIVNERLQWLGDKNASKQQAQSQRGYEHRPQDWLEEPRRWSSTCQSQEVRTESTACVQ